MNNRSFCELCFPFRENDRFNYASVYYNQTQDVHPPLFYFCCKRCAHYFPGSFTKWTGLGMNFVLLGGTLAALYALGMELFAGLEKKHCSSVHCMRSTVK